jgi:hypothetical protein
MLHRLRLEHSIISFDSLLFDPNEWCLMNGLLSGGLNPQPLSHESSAFATRPWLLTALVNIGSCLKFILSKMTALAMSWP